MSTSGGRAPRKNVAYTKPHEPAFLKAFKTKVGYKEPASVDSKREGIKPPCAGDDEREDREDELPAVVVLRHGNVGQEEFLEYIQRTKDQAKDKNESSDDHSDTKDSGSGRIMFKKPTKRKSSDSVLDATTSKRAKTKSISHTNSSSSRSSQDKSKGKQIKNRSLLSFGEEEDQP